MGVKVYPMTPYSLTTATMRRRIVIQPTRARNPLNSMPIKRGETIENGIFYLRPIHLIDIKHIPSVIQIETPTSTSNMNGSNSAGSKNSNTRGNPTNSGDSRRSTSSNKKRFYSGSGSKTDRDSTDNVLRSKGGGILRTMLIYRASMDLGRSGRVRINERSQILDISRKPSTLYLRGTTRSDIPEALGTIRTRSNRNNKLARHNYSAEKPGS
jgi:hypothetical protein